MVNEKQVMMTLKEAIKSRKSIRKYTEEELSAEAVKALREKIDEVNHKGALHVQLVLNEPKAFSGFQSYGKFVNARNYLVMAAEKGADERVGYYGEQLVLLAQQLGIGSCWVGLTYKKEPDFFQLQKGEKIYALISLGYPAETGKVQKHKTFLDVSNVGENTPDWFRDGVDAALLAPTAVNQQKFHLTYEAPDTVLAEKGFSLVGYTAIDLGIVKCHFEIGAGVDNFQWR